MNTLIKAALCSIVIFFACSDNTEPDAPAKPNTTDKAEQPAQKKDTASATAILQKKQVPVLCYHNIRSLKPGESKRMLEYYVPVANFKEQIKMLADSGYYTVTPEQYYRNLMFDEPLPAKPVMITFDDTDEEQYTIGAAELNKYGFKGVYFIMTISIGRPRYMSREQIKSLADSGHIIASHSWDHHNVKNYEEKDWDPQLLTTKQKLEELTGKPVEYFAYPFGIWKPEAIPELKKRGYKGAFQLSANKRDSLNPQYTLRRMIVPGDWDIKRMQRWMRATFPTAYNWRFSKAYFASLQKASNATIRFLKNEMRVPQLSFL